MNELKRNVEYRRREKEQDAIARAKIKARLGRFATSVQGRYPMMPGRNPMVMVLVF